MKMSAIPVMEIPIQVAVRILPSDEDSFCVQSLPMSPNFSPINSIISNIATGIIQVGSHSTFPVTHYLPAKVQQTQIYHQTVYPLVSLLLEGFDASVVTYGQKGTGKTYTLLGPGLDSGSFSEAEEGIIQRCAREIYSQFSTTYRERSFIVNIGWVEIKGEHVKDLLEIGSVVCQSVNDVFHWLQVGASNKSDNDAHNLFTIALEQHWISPEGLIQHKLSTASFTDLCGTERMYMLNSMDQHSSIPKDLGLQSLERIVTSLTDPSLIYNNNVIDYNQTILTTLLKDSFGGRAQTLLILCVSPLETDMNETIFNLQFAFKAQCVRNYVTMNTFSDNNTPLSPDVNGNVTGDQDMPISANVDKCNVQFAASQWLKLLSNAEGLFTKLLNNETVAEIDREQIEEWLFLKQECEECLSSNDVLPQKPLGPIQETDEPEETVSEPEHSSKQNSENGSDNESETQRTNFEEKIEHLMNEMKIKTDNLVRNKYDDFIKSQPKAVMESNESFRFDERKTSSGVGGRRRSIQPGASLSSAEIAMLSRVANRGEGLSKAAEDFLESSSDNHPIRIPNNPIDNIQKKIRKIETDIEAKQRQINELEHTMSLKQKLVSELIKTNDTRTSAKHRFNKKKGKLEGDYEKTKKQLSKAVVNGRDKSEIERLKALTSHIEQRLQDLVSIKHIAGESGEKVKKLQKSIHDSKKHIEGLQKNLKKERKTKEQLETDLKILKEKENNKSNLDEKGKNLKQVQARISHLDHVLKEKSQNLEQYKNTEEQESLRHEIRNLRRTRDHLLEQRCTLDRKLKKEKILSHREERKLLECDEAIEAIDAAIEFKNELICGRKSIDTNERLQREKGEQMLMARLNKLTVEEMRTLLYKYFTKVIDLRDSSRKLEVQLINLERERDAWEWRERVLNNAVRQARLEGERNAVLLQRQHETKLTLMLRHLAEETSTSTNSFNNERMPYHHHHHHHHQQIAITGNNHLPSSANQQYDSSELESNDFDLDFYKQHAVVAPHKQILKVKHADLGLCPLPDTITKYKPLDKIKEKDRESKKKLFAKFQVLTRYHNSSGGNSNHQNNISSGSNDKKTIKSNHDFPIPEENLKQLLSAPSSAKVTRQKNKIIIQDSSRKN